MKKVLVIVALVLLMSVLPAASALAESFVFLPTITTGSGTITAAAAPTTVEIDSPFHDVTFLGEEPGPPTGEEFTEEPNGTKVEGVLQVKEIPAGWNVTAKLEVPPGDVFTAWWVDCEEGTANAPGFDCVPVAAGKAAGRISPNGWFNFGRVLPPEADEIHLINHGEPDGGISDQIKNFWGGCLDDFGPNQCSVAFVNLTNP